MPQIPRKPSSSSNSMEPMFLTWNDEEGKKIALATAAEAYGVVAERQRSYGSDIFLNAGGQGSNVSVRDGMSRSDWEYFRPEEAIPRNFRSIMGACMMAYKRIGFIRNAIDLMGEFTCQGIRLVHQQPNIQTLYEEWAKKIGLYERSERFCNYLYRMGNVVIQRETAILRDSDIENLRRGLAAEDIQRIDPPPKVRKGEIPWSYTYLNPLTLEILGGDDLAQFAGVAMYGLTIPSQVFNKIKNPKTPEEKYIINQLPDYIVGAVRNGKKLIALDPAKVQTFFYKKDDWMLWAEPVLYGVIDDLILFNKMRLADLAALDGAISHIRLWKIGDIANHIIPTKAAMNRLAEVLVNNTSVGAIDVIWGPELTLEETSTDVYQFLGSEKYAQTMQNIYDGLGIPYPSQGGGKGKGGMASYLSLKVMVERLKYGRRMLNSFWEPEIVAFQKALGLRFPATLQYDYMVLTDENAWLRLLVELADRDLVSVEFVQEAFGMVPEVQQMLIRREHKQREAGKMKSKAGPFHQPQVEDDLLKIFAQTGIITPSQAGVELGDKAPGEQTMMDLKLKAQKQLTQQKQQLGGPPAGNPSAVTKPKGQPSPGRPNGKRDTQPRKQRSMKPTKAANFFSTRAWARQVQNAIAEVINPVYLQSCGKDTARKLTDEEAKNLEQFKFAVLCNLQPYSDFTEDKFMEMVNTPLLIPDTVNELMTMTLAKFAEKFDRTPAIDEIRLFQAEVYSLWSVDVEDEECEDDTLDVLSPVLTE